MMTRRVWLTDGTVPLPADLREAAGIPCDAELFITVADGVVLLTTRPSTFERAAREFVRLMDEAGISEADLLEGLEQTREEIYRQTYGTT